MKIISVDDHVIEPPDLWVEAASAQDRDRVPRVVHTAAYTRFGANGNEYVEDADHPQARPADVWVYERYKSFVTRGVAAAGSGIERQDLDNQPVSYAEMRPGYYQREARLLDMDENDTEVSLCFPTVSRFAGQMFLNREDPELALRCIRVYNDWMIDHWCAGEARGRLVPVTIVPLWDAELAAEEIRRCAGKGSRAVAFTENPPNLGLPSLYSGFWDPFIAACDETDTVINMHIGSGSKVTRTAPDCPAMVQTTLLFEWGMHAAIDWLVSGVLARYPSVRIALSEAQVGWLPFVLERLDNVWERNVFERSSPGVDPSRLAPDPPSSYVRGRVFGCIYDDVQGLRNRDAVGMGQIMFETDYPHLDSTWAESSSVAERLIASARLSEFEGWQLLRGNAISCFKLDKQYGITR
jgi:predicted TIM-barrel fold metal-dependent hydrolase